MGKTPSESVNNLLTHTPFIDQFVYCCVDNCSSHFNQSLVYNLLMLFPVTSFAQSHVVLTSHRRALRQAEIKHAARRVQLEVSTLSFAVSAPNLRPVSRFLDGTCVLKFMSPD